MLALLSDGCDEAQLRRNIWKVERAMVSPGRPQRIGEHGYCTHGRLLRSLAQTTRTWPSRKPEEAEECEWM